MEEATQIADRLVEEHLAACVSILPVQSIYRWNNSVCHDQEWQLMIKTDLHQFPQLQERAIALHSYDLPEMIAIPITLGYPPYLEWIAQETNVHPTQAPSLCNDE
jgi:periplasmic divalent cation tolerance protein